MCLSQWTAIFRIMGTQMWRATKNCDAPNLRGLRSTTAPSANSVVLWGTVVLFYSPKVPIDLVSHIFSERRLKIPRILKTAVHCDSAILAWWNFFNFETNKIILFPKLKPLYNLQFVCWLSLFCYPKCMFSRYLRSTRNRIILIDCATCRLPIYQLIWKRAKSVRRLR